MKATEITQPQSAQMPVIKHSFNKEYFEQFENYYIKAG